MTERHRIRLWIRHHRQALAFLFLAAIAAVAINYSASHTAKQSAEVVYRSQLASCVRGNLLREEVNKHIAQTSVTSGVVLSFLDGAAKARLANYKATHLQADLEAYETYTALAQDEAGLHYTHLPLIDCKTAIPQP